MAEPIHVQRVDGVTLIHVYRTGEPDTVLVVATYHAGRYTKQGEERLELLCWDIGRRYGSRVLVDRRAL